MYFMFIGQCIKVIFEEKRPTWCHLLFYFTPFNIFRTLIYPSSGAYDYSVELPHWSCVLVSMCVGVWVWLDWSGIRVAGWSFSHTEFKNTSKQEKHEQCGNSTDDGSINVWNMLSTYDVKQNSKWQQVGLLFFKAIHFKNVLIFIPCNFSHSIF